MREICTVTLSIKYRGARTGRDREREGGRVLPLCVELDNDCECANELDFLVWAAEEFPREEPPLGRALKALQDVLDS